MIAAQQVQQLGRIDRVGLDVLAAAVDLDGAGIDDDVVDALAGQGAMQPEAIATRLVAGADRGVGGQPEASLGLGDLLVEPGEIAGRHRAEARLLGRLRGAGQEPLVPAEFQGDVQGRGRVVVVVMSGSPSSRLMGSYLTETCTTSDTSLTTWYRTTKLARGGRYYDV